MLSPYKHHISTETTKQLATYDSGEPDVGLSPAAMEVLDAMTTPDTLYLGSEERRLARMAAFLISGYRRSEPSEAVLTAA